MNPQDQVVVTDRLRRTLLAFQTAESLLLAAHRRLKAVPQTELNAFWDGPGRRIGERAGYSDGGDRGFQGVLGGRAGCRRR